MWHKQVPQAPRAGRGFEVFNDLRVAMRISECLHLRLVDGLGWGDFRVDELLKFCQ
jgi:hypothetical protein